MKMCNTYACMHVGGTKGWLERLYLTIDEQLQAIGKHKHFTFVLSENLPRSPSLDTRPNSQFATASNRFGESTLSRKDIKGLSPNTCPKTLEEIRVAFHEPTVHFDSVSQLHEAATELSFHDLERLLTQATCLLWRLGAVVGLPALTEGKKRQPAGVVSSART